MENEEGTGLSVKHLEKTVFKDEIMIAGALGSRSVVSTITAGWLLDTGWYSNINYNLI